MEGSDFDGGEADATAFVVRWFSVRASTAKAVAASLIKRPVSEDMCRRLFTEEAGQKPSVTFWLLISQESPRLSWTLSRGTPASCRARVMRLVATPSLLPSIGVPSSRNHMFV